MTSLLTMFRRRIIHAHAREIGRMGGKARAAQMRAPYRDRARQLLAEMGKADDPRIPA